MSRWLNAFMARLNEVHTTQGATMSRQESQRRQLYELLNRRVSDVDAEHADFANLYMGRQVGRKMGGGGLDVGGGLKSIAGRGLDLISRPLYSVANMANYGVANEGTSSLGIFDPGVLGAGWRGLSGQEKTTFSDVLGTAGMEEGYARSGLGLVGDVFLDPTTYIGAGLIKQGIKGGFKLAGKEAPEIFDKGLRSKFRTKNKLKTFTEEDIVAEQAAKKAENVQHEMKSQSKEAPTPEKAAEQQLEITGLAKVHEDVADETIKKVSFDFPESRQNFDIVPEQVPENLTNVQRIISTPLPEQHALKFTSEGVKRQASLIKRLGEQKAAETKATKILEPFETRKYAEDIEIKPLYREVEQATGEKVPKKVTREVEEAVTSDANTALNDSLKKMDFGPGGSVKLLGRSGRPLAQDIKTGVIHPVEKGAQTISLKEIKAAVVANDIPDTWKAAHVTIGGKPTNLHAYAKILASGYKAGKAVAGKTTKRKITETVMEDVKAFVKKNPNAAQIAQWRKAHKEVLDQEDILHLTKALKEGGPDAFDEAVKEIKAKMIPGGRKFESLDELEQAMQKGELSEAEIAEVKKRLGGHRTIENLRKKIGATGEAAGKSAERSKAYADWEKNIAGWEENRGHMAGQTSDLNMSPWEPMTNPQVADEVRAAADETLNTGRAANPKSREQLTEWQAGVVDEALAKTNKSQFREPIEQNWERTPGGAFKNPSTGRVRWLKSFNQYSQMEVIGHLIENVARRVQSIPSDAARSAAFYDTFMPMLNAAEQTMRDHGIHQVLGKGSGNRGIALSLHDVLSSLPRDKVEKYFFDRPFNIKQGKNAGQVSALNAGATQFAQIAEQFIMRDIPIPGKAGLTDAEVKANIRNILEKDLGTIAPQPSHLTQKINRRSGPEKEKLLDELTDDFYKMFNDAAPQLRDTLTRNLSDMASNHVRQARIISDEAIKKYDDFINDPTKGAADRMAAANNRHKFVDEEVYLNRMHPDSEAAHTAHETMDAHVAEEQSAPAMSAAQKTSEGAKKAKDNGSKNEHVRAQNHMHDQAQHEANLANADAGRNYMDYGEKFGAGFAFNILRHMVPDMGQETLRRIYLSYNSAAQTYMKDQARILGEINKKYSKEELRDGWAAMRRAKSDENFTEVQKAIATAIKDLIDRHETGFGFFDRLVYDAKSMEREYAAKGLHIKIDPKDPKAFWRNLDADDPLDLFSRMGAAHMNHAAKQEMGTYFSREFGSKTYQKGYVKIRDTKGTSEFAKYIDTDMWYPEDIARQGHILDNTLQELMTEGPKSTMLKNLDTATHMWKAGVTIYRPGHHVRNAIGDMWFNFVQGVRSVDYVDAGRIMATRKGQYKDFDSLRIPQIRAMQDPTGGHIMSYTHGGKTYYVSPSQMYQLAHDSGGLPSYAILEDLGVDVAETDFQAQMRKFQPFKGNVHKFATGVSEGRDHYIRLAQFSREMKKIMKKGLQGKDMDTALHNAALEASARVRKWHPDGSDLTQFERKFMRRLIPFYSWTRKAIPLVLEAAVSKPGRTMIYPKAMYNWAEANGIDVNGIGDPFPTDQLFPSWIADSIQGPIFGEAGGYVGMRPGVPLGDIADEYLANPHQTKLTIAGSLNPLARVPIEFMSKTRLRTEGPIRDWSDYTDQQIPFATYINHLFGDRSLSSGFTQQTQQAPSNLEYENENMPGGAAAWRFFTGVDFPDYSKPSYIKNAQFEQKRAAKKAKEEGG